MRIPYSKVLLTLAEWYKRQKPKTVTEACILEVKKLRADVDQKVEEILRLLSDSTKGSGGGPPLFDTKEKGKIDEARENLLDTLHGRFSKIPKYVENTIRQMTDPIALDSWAEFATTCESMEEFESALD